MQHLSKELTAKFGKGFDVRNSQNMSAFYLTFPNPNAVRSQLTWTHYRILIRVKNEQARQWYLEEAITQNWSSEALIIFLRRMLSHAYVLINSLPK